MKDVKDGHYEFKPCECIMCKEGKVCVTESLNRLGGPIASMREEPWERSTNGLAERLTAAEKKIVTLEAWIIELTKRMNRGPTRY